MTFPNTLRGAICTAWICALTATVPASAQELGELPRLIQVGIGYGFAGKTSVLTDPLPLSGNAAGTLLELPELPASCFREPGVTALNNARIESASDVLSYAPVIALAGARLTVQCGEFSTVALPLLQAPLDGEWKRFVNPNQDVINAYFEAMADLRIKRLIEASPESAETYAIRRNRHGGIDLGGAGPISTGARLNRDDGRYYEAHLLRFTSERNADLAASALNTLGCNATRANADPDGYETVWVAGTALDPSAILEHSRQMIQTSVGFMIINAHISLMETEAARARHSGGQIKALDARNLAARLPQNLCAD